MYKRLVPLLALFACSDGKIAVTDDSAAVDDSGDNTPTDDTAVDGDDSGDDTAADSGDDTATDSGDSGGDDTDDSGGDTADTAEPEPAPASSRCIVSTDTTGACTNGVYADDWTGSVRYEWKVIDGFNHSEITAVEGGVSTTITTVATEISWHMTGGLTVMPDGDLVIGGITLPYVDLIIGTDTTSLGADYVRFIARISPTGTVRWVKTIVGITGESIVLAARTDDTVLASGNFYLDTVFDSYTVSPSSYLWDSTFLAELDADGNWLWANSAPIASTGYTRVYFDDMVAAMDGSAAVAVRYQSSVALSMGSFTCAAGYICAATVNAEADGTWGDVEPR